MQRDQLGGSYESLGKRCRCPGLRAECGDGERLLDWAYILNTGARGLADGLDVRKDGRKRMTFRFLVPFLVKWWSSYRGGKQWERSVCVVVEIKSLILEMRSLNGNFTPQWRFWVGSWIYGESSGQEDGTGHFNLRIISIERRKKRWLV